MSVDICSKPLNHSLRPVRTKTCKGCAFRRGSQERADIWGWLQRVEAWFDNGHHYCHENVPGHHQEVLDGSTRWMTCCSYERFKHKKIPIEKIIDAAMKDKP